MNTIQRIAKNTGVLLIAQVIAKFLSFFYIMYTARYLGAAGFGILSFALAFTGMFGVFADLGLSTLTVREVARDKSLASKYLTNIGAMKIILVIITFGLVALIINLLGYPQQTIKVVYLVALSVIFNAFSGMFYSIFQAFEKMEYASLGQILSSVLMLGGVILAINQGFSVVGFASLYLIASVIILGYSLIILRWKFVNPTLIETSWKMKIDWNFWKPTIKEALPFGLSAVFVTIYFWIDTIMLSLMKGDAVVGLYNAAYRFVYVLLFIPAAYFSSIYPIMSKFYKTSKDSLRFSYEKSLKYILIIAFPIAIGVSFFADKIILLIFKAEFAPSIPALQILVWAVFFSYLAHATLYTLNSINRQIIYTKITFLAMVLNVVLNLIFIPILSFVGASMTTLFTEFIGFSLMFYYLKRYFGNSIRYVFMVRSIFVMGIISILMLALTNFINAYLSFFICIGIYLAFLYLFSIFTKEDVTLFKNVLVPLPNKGVNKGE